MIVQLLEIGVSLAQLKLCFEAINVRPDNPIDPWLIFEFLKAGLTPENVKFCYEALAIRDD